MPAASAVRISYTLISVVCLAALVAWPVLAAELPYTGGYGEARFRLFAPVAPVLGLYFLAMLCSRILRKRKELGLGLAPEGVYAWTLFGCCFFAWDWISAIHITSRTGPGATLVVHEPVHRPTNAEENWTARLSYFRRKRERLNFGFLAVNPAFAYHAVRFYHQHPEHRAELATDAAVQRIRTGDLPT